jgi:DNA primase
MTARPRHPASGAVPILAAAAALGLEVAGRKARCFNGRAHQSGEDRHPSLVLFPDHGRFKCYACGVHGDVIDLVRAVLGASFRDAVGWVERLAAGGAHAAHASHQASRPTPPAKAQLAEVYGALFALASPPTPDSPAGAYLLGRRIDPVLAAGVGVREVLDAPSVWGGLRSRFGDETLRSAGLASRAGDFLFARHRLLFFYLDAAEPAFVQARDFTGASAAKELRPSGVPCPAPFNRDVLRGPPDVVHVCEGCIDALSALQLGLPAVGVPGVQSFREEWFALFRGVREVRVLFDDDEAGRRQGAELRARFRLRGFRADAFHTPRGKDVNDFLVLLQRGVQP